MRPFLTYLYGTVMALFWNNQLFFHLYGWLFCYFLLRLLFFFFYFLNFLIQAIVLEYPAFKRNYHLKVMLKLWVFSKSDEELEKADKRRINNAAVINRDQDPPGNKKAQLVLSAGSEEACEQPDDNCDDANNSSVIHVHENNHLIKSKSFDSKSSQSITTLNKALAPPGLCAARPSITIRGGKANIRLNSNFSVKHTNSRTTLFNNTLSGQNIGGDDNDAVDLYDHTSYEPGEETEQLDCEPESSSDPRTIDSVEPRRQEDAGLSGEVLEDAGLSGEVLEEDAGLSGEVLEEDADLSGEVLEEDVDLSGEVLEEDTGLDGEVLEFVDASGAGHNGVIELHGETEDQVKQKSDGIVRLAFVHNFQAMIVRLVVLLGYL